MSTYHVEGTYFVLYLKSDPGNDRTIDYYSVITLYSLFFFISKFFVHIIILNMIFKE